MYDTQLQAIKDVIKMTPKVNFNCLIAVKQLMEKAIDEELLTLEPSIVLENMDITEKLMYLDYLHESKETKKDEQKNAISLEEILKREEIDFNDLQDTDNA